MMLGILAYQNDTLWSFVMKGGPVMWPIIAASVIGVAVFLERLVRLRLGAVIPHGLAARIVRLVTEGRREDALRILDSGSTPLHRILDTVLRRYAAEGPDAVEEQAEREYRRLYRGVELIGVLAGISPLLGLLGTVTGMIQVFRNVMNSAHVKGVDPASLAGGIWEALLTTAAGLMVAIPLFLVYRYLQYRVDSLMFGLQEDAKKLAAALSAGDDSPRPSPSLEEDESVTTE